MPLNRRHPCRIAGSILNITPTDIMSGSHHPLTDIISGPQRSSLIGYYHVRYSRFQTLQLLLIVIEILFEQFKIVKYIEIVILSISHHHPITDIKSRELSLRCCHRHPNPQHPSITITFDRKSRVPLHPCRTTTTPTDRKSRSQTAIPHEYHIVYTCNYDQLKT